MKSWILFLIIISALLGLFVGLILFCYWLDKQEIKKLRNHRGKKS